MRDQQTQSFCQLMFHPVRVVSICRRLFVAGKKNTQQKHSPDGKKRGGADAASLGGPLVMQVVRQPIISNLTITTHHERF